MESSAHIGIWRNLRPWLCVGLLACSSPSRTEAGVLTLPGGSDDVANGAAFQEALHRAACGDTIVLQAGATYGTSVDFVSSGGPQGGPFTLPNKGDCAGQYITIQTSALASLPAGGRVTPAHASLLARVVTNSGSAAIQPAIRAGWYRLIGLEITNSANVPNNNGFVPNLVGAPNGGYFEYGEWAHDIIFDRVWVHPYEEVANPSTFLRSAAMGMRLDGARITVMNSTINGFVGFQSNSPTTPAQTTGIGIVAGPGPMAITNNYIEAWYANIFTGGGGGMTANKHTVTASTMTSLTVGGTPQNLSVGDLIAFRVPTFANGAGIHSDWACGRVTAINGQTITFSGFGVSANQAAPIVGGTAQWNGVKIDGMTVTGNMFVKRANWVNQSFGTAKAIWEMKDGNHVLFEGNTVDIPKGSAPLTAAFATNQDGSAPWATTSHNVFRSNLFIGLGTLMIQLKSPYHSSKDSTDILIENNLFPSSVRLDAMLGEGGSNVRILHNTFRSNSRSMVANSSSGGAPMQGLLLRDNILNSGEYWIGGDTAHFPSHVQDRNVVVNTSGGATPGYMTGNFIVANDTGVGFANLANADAGGDWRGYALASTSSFKGRASDGTDPGVNVSVLDNALKGLAAGPITSAPSPPQDLRLQ
jgi:hypothetical protein